MKYTLFRGGKYTKFILKGPDSDIPKACGVVFGMVDGGKITYRERHDEPSGHPTV